MNSMYNAILHKTIKVHNPSSQEINQTQSIMIYACPKHEFYMKTWWFNAEKTDKKKRKESKLNLFFSSNVKIFFRRGGWSLS